MKDCFSLVLMALLSDTIRYSPNEKPDRSAHMHIWSGLNFESLNKVNGGRAVAGPLSQCIDAILGHGWLHSWNASTPRLT